MPRVPLVNENQEAVIRQFVEGCHLTEITMPGEVYRWLMAQLDYKVLPSGARVSTDTEVKVKFGRGFDEYDDEYYTDWAILTEDELEDNAEPSASEPSESDTVGDALRKEV